MLYVSASFIVTVPGFGVRRRTSVCSSSGGGVQDESMRPRVGMAPYVTGLNGCSSFFFPIVGFYGSNYIKIFQ